MPYSKVQLLTDVCLRYGCEHQPPPLTRQVQKYAKRDTRQCDVEEDDIVDNCVHWSTSPARHSISSVGVTCNLLTSFCVGVAQPGSSAASVQVDTDVQPHDNRMVFSSISQCELYNCGLANSWVHGVADMSITVVCM